MAPKHWQYFILLLLATLVRSAPVDAGVESGETPPDVTPEEFAAFKDTYFIKFYSPLCHHCRELAPKWDGAYRDMGGENTKGFKWAGVNCIVHSDFCTENHISGYPTLRVYRNAERIYDYSNSGPSQLDLRSFAENYVKLGDKAFSKDYEQASNEVAELDTASKDSEKAAFDAEKLEAESSEKKNSNKEASEKDLSKKKGKVDKEADMSDGQVSNNPPVFTGSETVVALRAQDFGMDKNVGRWFVLFTGDDCEECESLTKKWDKHENFARDINGINWGRVDCAADEGLCVAQDVRSIPSLRIYQDGVFIYTYEGPQDSISLRKFLVFAESASNFDGFSFSDLDGGSSSSNMDSKLEGAGPNQEPNYLSGPEVQKPNYNGEKPKILDVVKYTLDTLGKPIDEDPGKLIFGDSPEAHHNFRNWGAPDAKPPAVFTPGSGATHANGKVQELGTDDFEKLVKSSDEPWLVKFYSPKCPHCQSMAAAYGDLALQVKGKLNVAGVNCEVHSKLCDAENVKAWPHIALYRGSISLDPYEGPRTANDMMNYCQTAWEAQIYPIDNEADLTDEIVSNMNSNITTFVYLYDQSVMAEDWRSLSKVATIINKWGGKIYRSDNDQLRELAGINHRGTAFVNVDYLGKPNEGALKWYDYPWSNIPKKIRDVDEVSNWAYRAKWSLLQYIEPRSQTKYSPYVAVLLTDGVSPPSNDDSVFEHHRKALELRDFYIKRQIDDQDKLRIDRLRQHDKALVENKFKHARYLMRQPIETPVLMDLAFAYIPLNRWVQDYAKYVDVSKHQIGNVIVLDFYHGVYLDEFNLVPINDNRDVLDDVVELLRRYQVKDPKTTFKSIHHFKTSMSNVPQPEHRHLHFQSLPYKGKDPLYSSISTIFKFLIFTSCLYLLFTKVVRPRLRALAGRNRARGVNEFKGDF